MTSVALHRRFDQLASLLDWWRHVPPETRLDDDRDAARRALVAEARLLDDARLDEWLAGWDADGVLWVPIDATSNPGTDQSFYLDDVRRMRERVAWRGQSSAWSQQPPVRTVRSVANIESRLADDGSLHVRSSLTIFEQHGQTSHAWSGHQFHVLAPERGDGARRRVVKVICVPGLAVAVPHPGVIL